MKKITILLISVFLFSLMGTAQNETQDNNRLRFALFGNPNVSWLKPENKNVSKEGNRVGFAYGAIIDFPVGPNLAISSGLTVLNTGGNVSYTDTMTPTGGSNYQTVTNNSTFKIRYVEVPFTLRMKTNQIGYISYFGLFGLGAGVNIKGRKDEEVTYADGTTKSEEDIDAMDEVAALRASLIIGGGIEYNLSGNTNLMIGVTFNNGFSNALSIDGFVTNDNGDIETNTDGSPKIGDKLKAINNHLGLTVGFFF